MANSKKDTRKGSRHKPRVQVGIAPDLYAAIKKLAGQNSRPVNWEVAVHLKKAAEDAGLWPPKPA